jgi:hypothetical protein
MESLTKRPSIAGRLRGTAWSEALLSGLKAPTWLDESSVRGVECRDAFSRGPEGPVLRPYPNRTLIEPRRRLRKRVGSALSRAAIERFLI